MNNYMIYALVWNEDKRKYDKKPVGLRGEGLEKDKGIPTADRATVERSIAALGDGYCLGIWFQPNSGYFFFDLDEVGDATTGQMQPDALKWVTPFIAAGCYFEWSSSGRGCHIIGRYSGTLPSHRTKLKGVHSYEFYTGDRGCALNVSSNQGSMEQDATALVLEMLPTLFPPRAEGQLHEVGDGPRPEWRGPTDDDELIRKMLSATGSAAARLGGKASFAKLWNGEVEHGSESDMALAAHLAFWTGCDPVRMERLMRRSKLARPKWDEHRTYLRELTIDHACATTQSVYQEPQRVDVAKAMLGTPMAQPPPVPGAGTTGTLVADATDWGSVTDSTINALNNTGTFNDLIAYLGTLGSVGFPALFGERVVTAANKRLDLFDARMPVASLRKLIMPPVVMESGAAPEWILPFVYVKRTDKFYSTRTGGEYTHESFRMEYGRMMQMSPTGRRADPVEAARDKWNIVTVDDVIYRPDQDTVFSQDGVVYANKFNPHSFPAVTEPSQEAKDCILLFQQHLYDMVSRRDDLYAQLLCWIAHNVQKPGHKIRWSPLIKGVPGDGKSIVGDLLFAVMSGSNVKLTSAATLANSGGFTDWATGAAVNFMEEIRLEGKEKRRLYNAMKIFIGDTRIELNSKGLRAATRTLINVTNHWANSNYGDGVPVDDGERRWCIIFTPYTDIDECVAMKGLADRKDLIRYFKRLGASMRAEPGAWRGWLMNIDLSSFDPDDRAPDTPERESMKAASRDANEQAISDCIKSKSPGVCAEAFCSSSLMGKVEVETREKPSAHSWNRILTDLGYRQFPRPLWWNGKTRRVWTKKALDEEKIKEILTATLQ